MTEKKAGKKKPAKKAKKKRASRAIDTLPDPDVLVHEPPEIRILSQIELTPAVLEILKSSEAKLYLGGIARADQKLQAMIGREAVLARHPGYSGR